MTSAQRVLGFDRRITLEWLEATLRLIALGLPPAEIRQRLDPTLDGHVSGSSAHSARGKTKTVLMHIWVNVPPSSVGLRNRGVELSGLLTDESRLALHWGMCLATYPFFCDLALTTGRLLQMQDEVRLAQVHRRMTEIWGDRSTLTRAVQRAIRNFAEWKVLSETERRSHYTPAEKVKLTHQPALSAWLLEALIVGSNSTSRSLKELLASPVFFPFELSLSSAELQRHSGLEVIRHGLDDEIVLLR